MTWLFAGGKSEKHGNKWFFTECYGDLSIPAMLYGMIKRVIYTNIRICELSVMYGIFTRTQATSFLFILF